MDKQWRPKGWQGCYRSTSNPYILRGDGCVNPDLVRAFEAGADAILEALRRDAFWLIDKKHSVRIDDIECNFSNGKIVFIPNNS